MARMYDLGELLAGIRNPYAGVGPVDYGTGIAQGIAAGAGSLNNDINTYTDRRMREAQFDADVNKNAVNARLAGDTLALNRANSQFGQSLALDRTALDNYWNAYNAQNAADVYNDRANFEAFTANENIRLAAENSRNQTELANTTLGMNSFYSGLGAKNDAEALGLNKWLALQPPQQGNLLVQPGLNGGYIYADTEPMQHGSKGYEALIERYAALTRPKSRVPLVGSKGGELTQAPEEVRNAASALFGQGFIPDRVAAVYDGRGTFGTKYIDTPEFGRVSYMYKITAINPYSREIQEITVTDGVNNQ